MAEETGSFIAALNDWARRVKMDKGTPRQAGVLDPRASASAHSRDTLARFFTLAVTQAQTTGAPSLTITDHGGRVVIAYTVGGRTFLLPPPPYSAGIAIMAELCRASGADTPGSSGTIRLGVSHTLKTLTVHNDGTSLTISWDE